MTDGGIMIDFAERREVIVRDSKLLAATLQYNGETGSVDVEHESDLIDEIADLVEYPTVLAGRFDERYLEVPEDVLTAVMRKHQRYLPVRNAAGELLRHFVVVANGTLDPATVLAGNEAVLRARFEAAAF